MFISDLFSFSGKFVLDFYSYIHLSCYSNIRKSNHSTEYKNKKSLRKTKSISDVFISSILSFFNLF